MAHRSKIPASDRARTREPRPSAARRSFEKAYSQPRAPSRISRSRFSGPGHVDLHNPRKITGALNAPPVLSLSPSTPTPGLSLSLPQPHLARAFFARDSRSSGAAQKRAELAAARRREGRSSARSRKKRARGRRRRAVGGGRGSRPAKNIARGVWDAATSRSRGRRFLSPTLPSPGPRRGRVERARREGCDALRVGRAVGGEPALPRERDKQCAPRYRAIRLAPGARTETRPTASQLCPARPSSRSPGPDGRAPARSRPGCGCLPVCVCVCLVCLSPPGACAVRPVHAVPGPASRSPRECPRRSGRVARAAE